MFYLSHFKLFHQIMSKRRAPQNKDTMATEDRDEVEEDDEIVARNNEGVRGIPPRVLSFTRRYDADTRFLTGYFPDDIVNKSEEGVKELKRRIDFLVASLWYHIGPIKKFVLLALSHSPANDVVVTPKQTQNLVEALRNYLDDLVEYFILFRYMDCGRCQPFDRYVNFDPLFAQRYSDLEGSANGSKSRYCLDSITEDLSIFEHALECAAKMKNRSPTLKAQVILLYSIMLPQIELN